MESKPKKKLNVPGTKLSTNNTQLLISSGIPSLDDLVGGGFPVGSVILIEEDDVGVYSKVILQYFLAEGVVCKHSLFIASDDVTPKSIGANLPENISCDDEERPGSKVDDSLTIAWRYKKLPTTQAMRTRTFGHYFDLTKKMAETVIDEAQISYWNSTNINTTLMMFANPAYHNLLHTIKTKLNTDNFMINTNNLSQTILRVAIHSLGSPLWHSDKPSSTKDLSTFIYCLRALMRSAFAVAVVTIPSNVIDKNIISRCVHSSDISLRLQTFSGTELEKNSALSDYQGFLYLTKLAAINTLVSKESGPTDYAFKLRRKKFTIEKLHLPPELQSSSEREQDDVISVGCGSGSKNLLEF